LPQDVSLDFPLKTRLTETDNFYVETLIDIPNILPSGLFCTSIQKMPDIRTIHIAPKVGSFPTDRVFYCDPEGTIVNGRIGFYLASGVTTSAVTGIGTGLDVNITSVQAKSGAVISFEVSKLGLNYKDGDVVMIAQAGSGLNATFKVNTSSTLNQGDVFTVDNGPLDANGIPVRQEAYS
jgi:hypothetical protein